MIKYFWILLILVIILTVIILSNKSEKFTPCEKIAWELNFPRPIKFDYTYTYPNFNHTNTNNSNFSRPWCVNKIGWAKPCPCPNLDPCLKEIGPVPVLNTSQGAYTVSRFNPGPPIA